PASFDGEAVGDDRLRLIFTCCHPALAPEAQVALTLREICGLTTEEIARAHSLRSSGTRRSARAPRCGAARGLSRLQRGLFRVERRGGDAPRSFERSDQARATFDRAPARAGSGRLARVDAAA